MTDILSLSAAMLLGYAAFHDLAVRTVPNWLPLCLFGLGLAARLIDHSFAAGLAVSLATFGLLFSFWLARLLGGGDVKLWTAAVMLVPPALSPEVDFFLRVLLFGGALAVLYFGLRWVLPRPRKSRHAGLLRRALRVEAWRIRHAQKLPYAVAIAASAIVTVLPQASGT